MQSKTDSRIDSKTNAEAHAKSHAVIIGGSLAGLLMSRVLSDYFDRVTVIERDIYPDQPAPRKGVPQSRFPHTLMLRGQQIFEQFFPGLKAELKTQGAIELDSTKEIAFLTPAGWAPRVPSDLMLLACSRDLLGWNIRRRLAAVANVEFLTAARVTGFLTDAEHQKITGVSLQRREKPREYPDAEQREDHQQNYQQNYHENLYADLIVDASGKASHTPQWLQALGYEPPAETEVDAKVGYVARIYQPPRDRSIDWKLIFAPSAPPQQPRGGAIFPIEGDSAHPDQMRWIISMVGGDGDCPPTDEAGFLAFARSLSTPAIAEVMEQATPISPIYAFYGNENRQRHYDRLSRFPARLLVVGHAACLLNPTYGQAMTVAALEALTLDRFFQHHAIADLDQKTFDLQKQLAKAHQEAWTAATSMDYRYTCNQDKPVSMATRFTNWYWDYLMEVVVDRPAVHHTFLEVLHLLKPSSVLMQPAILAQVLWKALRGGRRSNSQQELAFSERSSQQVVFPIER
ncbi:NAD(P)/FAD-dependent oxidoreductase [Leptolyngbya ohadii]|uniref:NAD(P)/FAD-dependent oxidoreductase n=1 Tax=Leptolyngbya ohadii TaxID=1962290 RepID=UPI0015C5842C|nr:2-polyprenyl-6-methoxyphenol hydroxylase-like oxidoreductase [Leptolyngbya ohadii]